MTQRCAAIAIAHPVRFLGQIESTLGCGGGNQAVRLLIEDVAGPHRLRRLLDVLLITIEVRQHGIAALQAFPLRIAGQAQVADLEVRRVRVIADLERIVLIAQEAADAAIEPPVDIVSQLHEGEHAMLVAPLPGDHRAIAREGQRRVELVAGHHEMIGDAVTAVLWVVAADDAEFVRLAGQERQMLNQAHAGKRGRDRGKLSANLNRGVRLGVKGIDMAWAALHPQQNATDRLVGLVAGRSGRLAQTQQTRHAQAEDRERSNPKKLTACDPGAVGGCSGEKIEHGVLSSEAG